MVLHLGWLLLLARQHPAVMEVSSQHPYPDMGSRAVQSGMDLSKHLKGDMGTNQEHPVDMGASRKHHSQDTDNQAVLLGMGARRLRNLDMVQLLLAARQRVLRKRQRRRRHQPHLLSMAFPLLGRYPLPNRMLTQ